MPVKVRWPDAATASAGPHPVVLFSHGLGGTREGGEGWGEAWAAAGFVVVHLQHTGSDLAAVRAVANTFTDKRALRLAASPAQLLARLRDVTFALDEIGRRQAAQLERWASVRLVQVGLCGHSFGAYTTLGMAGQRYPGFEGMDEPRLAAFIAFSPSLPAVGDARQAFDRITRPLLCITGTRDSDVAGTDATPERRAAVFDALPSVAAEMTNLQLTLFLDKLAFPESPRWHDGALWFSDFYTHRVQRVDMAGRCETVSRRPGQRGGGRFAFPQWRGDHPG